MTTRAGAPDPGTWLHPSAEPRRSPIHGTGLFAHTDLPAGLTVSRLGGRLVTDDLSFRLVCRCGAPDCRGVVTGADWRRAELQARYGDHWVPVLRDRIASASA